MRHIEFNYNTIEQVFRKLIADKFFLSALLIFITGTFLRFYKLAEFTTFLADQGRDAIIVKRIVTLEHLPAIGAPTSIGQVYLGPFYYYFIAPWLLLFNFNPLGLTVGVAFFSSLYILITYFLVENLFDKKVALISTILVAYSSTLIDFSRFSWNPNLLPLFTLITVFFFIKAIEKHNIKYFFLTGAFFSFSAQLHYIALILGLPIVLITLFSFRRSKRELVKFSKCTIAFISSTLLFSLPLILFDLRHGFINTKNFLSLVGGEGTFSSNKILDFFFSFSTFNNYALIPNLNFAVSSVILISFIISFLALLRTKSSLKTILVFFVLSFLGVTLYSGPRHQHYYAVLYPIYYIILAYYLVSAFWTKKKIALLILFISGFIVLNSNNYFFLNNKGSFQIRRAKQTAKFIGSKIDNKDFNFAVQPDGWHEDAYLYFLELRGKVPVDRRNVEISDQMFVVCGEPCNLKKTKSWNVTMFGDFKIKKHWKYEGIDLYKLVHAP